MKSRILLCLTVLALCTSNETVTKYAPEIANVCDPNGHTSFSSASAPAFFNTTSQSLPSNVSLTATSAPFLPTNSSSSTIAPSSTAGYNASEPDDGLIDVSIYNDFTIDDIVVAYTWDCNMAQCTSLANVSRPAIYSTASSTETDDSSTTALPSASSISSSTSISSAPSTVTSVSTSLTTVTSLSTSTSTTTVYTGGVTSAVSTIKVGTTAVSVVKRDSGNSKEAWKQAQVNHMQDELKDTKDIDPEITELNSLLGNHTFMGALSVYEDLARTAEVSTHPELNLFRNIWANMWKLFYKNNKSGQNNLHKTLDTASILMILTPNYYNVQRKDYEHVRACLDDRFNDPNSKKDFGIRAIMQFLDDDELNYVIKLAGGGETRDKYVTYMLNLYYQYGVTNGYEASSKCKSKRVVQGLGAMKGGADAATKNAVTTTAAGWASLFGLGNPILPRSATLPQGPRLSFPRISSTMPQRVVTALSKSLLLLALIPLPPAVAAAAAQHV